MLIMHSSEVKQSTTACKCTTLLSYVTFNHRHLASTSCRNLPTTISLVVRTTLLSTKTPDTCTQWEATLALVVSTSSTSVTPPIHSSKPVMQTMVLFTTRSASSTVVQMLTTKDERYASATMKSR